MKTGILTFLVTLGSFSLTFSNTPTTAPETTCFIAPVIDFSSIVCDDNGTPFDPEDDVIISFDVTVNGNNDETTPLASNTFNDDQNTGNTGLAYGTILSYDFSSAPVPTDYTITFTDVDDPTCTSTIVLGTTCSDATCEIIPDAASNIVCDDNDTPFDDSDDTFTFDITVNGSNTDMTTPATNTFNDDQGNSAIAYGSTISYGPFDISNGAITVNFTDADAPTDIACTAVMVAVPPATCSPATCEIIPDAATNIVCGDNDTPFDDSDDTFTFDITVNGDNTEASASDTFNDDQGNVGIAYGSTVSYGPFSISGGPIVVAYTDADAPAEVACTATMMAMPPITCSDAECEVIPDAAINIVCNDNGTPFDDSDDTFTFDITVNGSNTEASASNTFNDDQGNIGIAYGSTLSYGPFSISGGSIVVAYTDADAPADVACTATMTAAPPATCSDAECSVTPDPAANIVCDDAGTPFDASDDTFTFDITVNGSNTEASASNTFNDDQGNTGVAYATTLSYGPFPISGGPIVVTYTDADAPVEVACIATMMAAPPARCSDAMCSITPEAPSSVVCDDAGTPFDASDDSFTFDITINGDNTDANASDTFNDDQGNSGIAYGSTLSYGPFPISGGAVEINYIDTDAPADADCIAMMMGIPPDTCSDAECSVTPDAAANIVCDDAGTPFDDSDDTFTFDITVNGSNTDPTASNTFNDDQGNAGIAYGSTLSYGPFLISGGSIVVMYTDADAPTEVACTGMMMATPPATCSVAVCSVEPDPAANIACDDAGTPFDDSDDTFTFDITVNGDNTDTGASDTFNDDRGNVGIAYGSTISYGPFPISGGPIVVMYTDADAPADVACTGMMMAAPPATCSEAVCSVEPDPAANIVCSNNGTPFDDSDDTFTFDITVNGDNTDSGASDTFNDDQGNTGIAYGSIISYGPFPISGGPIVVTYTDADAPADVACTAMMMAASPATCSEAVCSVEPDPAANIVCNDNGTPFDDSDDTFTFDITVNGSNTDPTASNTFNDDQGNAGIAYGSTLSYGPFPINGGPIAVMYTDADAPADLTCTGMMTAEPPATCSDAECMITPEIIDIICEDNGTLDDRTDDTFTFNVLVNGGNTIPGANNTFDDDQFNLGVTYGTELHYGPFPISGGSITVNYEDTYTLECIASVTASPPPTCSPEAEVPTVGEWGLIILGLMMSITAVVGIRQRKEEEIYG